MATKLLVHVEEYLTEQAKYQSPRSLRSIGSVLRRIAKMWDDTRRSPKNLDGVFVEQWFASLNVAPATRAVYRSYANEFLKWAKRRKYVGPDALDFHIPASDASNRSRPLLWLPGSFFDEAIEAEQDWYWRGFLATLTYTLGRGIELRERRIADVRLGDSAIFWPRTKTHDFDDFLPMFPAFKEELIRYLAAYREQAGHQLRDDYYLFPRYRLFGQGTQPRVFPTEQRCVITGPAKRLIAKNLDPEALADDPDMMVGAGGHTVRRSMARAMYERLLEMGEPDPMAVVQGMLGHKKRDMTERYIGMNSIRERRNAVVRGMDLFPKAGATVVDIRNRREG